MSKNTLAASPERCYICDHYFAELHRVNPGAWGGDYTADNVIWLCPNHHTSLHVLMKWYHKGGKRMGESAARVLELIYNEDRKLWRFFFEHIKPVVVERMKAEGRWHPYVRTLPERTVGITKE